MATFSVALSEGMPVTTVINQINRSLAALNQKEASTVTLGDDATLSFDYTLAPKPKEAIQDALVLLQANAQTGLTTQQVAALIASLQAVSYPAV